MTIQFFLRYLFSKRAGALIRIISWICVFGIGLGVMSLIVVLSVMNGFNGTIRDRLLAVDPHLVVGSIVSENRDSTEIRNSLAELQSEFGQIRSVDTDLVESQDVILKTLDGTFGGAIAKGMDVGDLQNILVSVQKVGQRHKGHYGEEIEVRDSEEGVGGVKELARLGPKEVILGADLARSLRILEGDQIMVIPPESLLKPKGEALVYETVTVKALLNSRVADIDSKFMFYHLGQTLGQFKKSASREINLELRFKDPGDHVLYEGDLHKRGFRTSNWIERNEALFFALKMEKLAMTIFLALSALITCFSIITVLVLLLTQKRRDLGILMAMGLSQTRTRWIFTRVGMILSLTGMLSGLGLGLGLCWVLDKYPIDLLPDIYYDSSIPVLVTRELVYFVIFVSVIVAFVSSYFPARANTVKWPALALRRGTK
ncbi:MAG: ABC transporter permease [Bdellovibrionales bacterium]|nr:ABC transporter permease [Bdellovibrionales bacterium]